MLAGVLIAAVSTVLAIHCVRACNATRGRFPACVGEQDYGTHVIALSGAGRLICGIASLIGKVSDGRKK